eukprot:CAMPEP_0177777468 /NCGR_PEP_ID=MMETSP0491_2-20121128/15383_1 /TAXON_ID=63592 /ORGANISM="Tetraselmis chuii, Strain PLY429" /LENGTH=123 /DNA_ID=CAMNT_0019296569 /DNA_START=159 /DNA_END=528 /DNA_ORIENTATION=-
MSFLLPCQQNPAMLSDPPPRPPPLQKFSPVKPQSSAQSRAPNAGPQRQAAPEPEAKPEEGLLGMLLQKIEDLEVRVTDVATSVQSIGEHSGGVLGELAKTGGLGSSGALLGDGPAAGSSSVAW